MESRYAFLDRAGGPVFDRIRELIETWYDDYPAKGKPDLRSRLQSDDDRASSGAFWELYQATSLRRAGLTISVHPDVPGTDRHPDFLVEDGVRSFYLETTLAGESDADRAARRRKARIIDALNATPSPTFFLGVEIDTQGPRDVSTRALKADVGEWLAGIDPRGRGETGDADAFRDEHTVRWIRDGWELTLFPIPKSPALRGKPGRTVGIYPSEGGAIDVTTPVRRAVREKAGRYGQLDRPYVVAVLIENAFVDDEDVLDSLFGDVAVSFRRGRPAAPQAHTIRIRNGAWIAADGPTRRRVSAVLTAINLAPWSVTRVEPVLWCNPWANRPIEADLGWMRREVDPKAGSIMLHPASHPAAARFGLPAEWPGPEEPFDEATS